MVKSLLKKKSISNQNKMNDAISSVFIPHNEIVNKWH